MTTVTASTMILSSLRRIGEKAVGGTLTTAEQTDYLYDLNAFMGLQGLDRMLIPHLIEDSVSLTASDGGYTIGPGGDINTVRPLKIEQAWVRDSGDADTPVEVIDSEAYDLIVLKTVDGSYPRWLYYDPTTPLGTVKLYPEPGSGLTLYLSSWKGLQKFNGIAVPLNLPDGYQTFIEFNFAIYVAGGYTNVSQEVAKIARESKAAIKSFNAPDVFMRLDAGLVPGANGSNIFTG